MRSLAGSFVPIGFALSAVLGIGSAACFDLFHSTSAIRSACELDAGACDDGGPALDASAVATDFCAWSPADATSHAEHACAWLGACETPTGGNAFGACMFDALLAYDCAANPSHPVRGKAHQLWDCLWRVGSCDDVQRCVFPRAPPRCVSPGDYTSCASGVEENVDVRVECVDGGVAFGDNCALRGQTCANSGGAGYCAGAAEDAGGLSCKTTECEGTHLHQCDGGDEGIDCASNGEQQCQGFHRPGDTTVDWIACVASGDAGCTPSLSAQCSDGYATSCPSGVAETIDCAELLRTPDAGCVPGFLSPPFDWTSPCQVVGPGACTADSCAGNTIAGCTRGATFTTDCAAHGLGPCTMVATDMKTEMHATCTQVR